METIFLTFIGTDYEYRNSHLEYCEVSILKQYGLCICFCSVSINGPLGHSVLRWQCKCSYQYYINSTITILVGHFFATHHFGGHSV